MSSRSATPRLRYRPKRDGDGLTRALRLEMNLELLMICRSELGLESTALTLEEIGDVLGLHKERVRQIEAGAMAKMRAFH